MSSFARWERRLTARGFELIAHADSHHSEYDPVPYWVVFVMPVRLPAEPLYIPPIGVGRGETLELAVRAAARNYSSAESELEPETRSYFERETRGRLPRVA